MIPHTSVIQNLLFVYITALSTIEPTFSYITQFCLIQSLLLSMPHNCMPCTVYYLYEPCNSIFCKAYIFCISQISILSPISLPLLAISAFQLHCLALPDNCLRSVEDCTPVYKFVITNNRILMSLFDQTWDPCSEHAYYKFVCGTNIYFLYAGTATRLQFVCQTEGIPQPCVIMRTDY